MAHSYLLRNLDSSVWARAKQRAIDSGRSLRWIILQLVARYADGEIDL